MLEVQTKTKKNVVIIEIQGDVDLYSSPQMRKTILNLIKKKKPMLLVNLGGVTYMDSSGVATLVESLQLINEYEGKLCIFNLRGAVREVFELSRLDKVFNIYEDESQALTACNDKN